MSGDLTDQLVNLGSSLGAAAVGVASAETFERELKSLLRHRADGTSGPLHFTYDDPYTAADVRRTFPWANRIISVGWNYLSDASDPAEEGAQVALFATANHYEPLAEVLEALATHLRQLGHRAEILIDDNRLVDRGAAVRAGVGWRGKSTMVLSPGHGPWMLLGSVITDATLVVTPPMTRTCGTCIACLPACPTGALSDGGLDARRCLSTWLQTRGSIPHWVRPHLGRRIYGCDDCLTACPPGMRVLGSTSRRTSHLALGELLELTDQALVDRFPWWYVPMRDGRYLRRNLLLAAGNSAEAGVERRIEAHLGHPSSMIRGVAAWSLARTRGPASVERLDHALSTERAQETRDEILLARLMVENPRRHKDVLKLDEWANTTKGVLAFGLLEPADGEGGAAIAVVAGGPGPRTSPAPTGMETVLTDALSAPAIDGIEAVIAVHDPERLLDAARRSARMQQGARG